ncbi:MAG TPA: hypothetical protein VEB64_10080 [Azospirillaceae bacterium]|nr:hypothetical protein [Azospirillaceae bacterium]
MSYFLLVVACLAGQPGTASCSQERIALPEIRNESACYLASRLRLQDWMADHGDRRVVDARCSVVDLKAAQNGAAPRATGSLP